MTRSASSTSTLRSAIDALTLALLAVLCLLAFFWDVVLLRVMVSLNMNDFGKFYYSTRAFLAGEDMYAPSPATQLGAGQLPDAQQLLNLNPPHFHLLVLPLAPLEPGVAVTIWMTVSAIALIVSLMVIGHELQFRPTPKRVLGVVFFALFFSGSQAVFITGQLTFLLLLPVTLCWRDARRGRWELVGVWLGILVSVKLFFLIFAPYLISQRRWKACMAMAGSAGVCLAIGLLVFGFRNYASWTTALAQSNDWAWLGMNASVLGTFRRVFAPSLSFQPLLVSPLLARGWIFMAGLIGFTTLAVVFTDKSGRAIDRAFALLLVSAQLLSPVGWVYYLWLAAGPVAALVARAEHTKIVASFPTGGPLLIALAGFFTPITAPYFFEPAVWATLTLGSVYCWAALALWVGIVTQL